MSEETWGYSNPVGEWVATLAMPSHLLGESMALLRHVLQLVVPLVKPMHRLRKAVISWGEVDTSGEEISFHELEDLGHVEWETLESGLREKVSSEYRVIVSALFLEMDTQVAAVGKEQGDTWAEQSAELQISFATPEVSAAVVAVMYSTSIDVWLPTTYAGDTSRSNQRLSAANLPRLESLLRSLASLSERELQLGQSRRYQDALSPAGFSYGATDCDAVSHALEAGGDVLVPRGADEGISIFGGGELVGGDADEGGRRR